MVIAIIINIHFLYGLYGLWVMGYGEYTGYGEYMGYGVIRV
jgi:hypothetical protein